MLFQMFKSTNPVTVAFIDNWLEQKPASAFAHSAKSWNLNTRSSNLRGEKLARDTYPDALRIFARMQQQAWDHALTAYQSEPRLISASDGLINLSVGTGRRGIGLEVLDAVMRTDPNWGTLSHGEYLAHPGWGGTWDLAEKICDTYAPLVPDPEPSPVLSCKLSIAHGYYRDRLDWVEETLNNEDLPHLGHLRLRRALTRNATPELAELSHRLLTRDGYINADQADTFDTFVAGKYGYPTLAEKHRQAEIDYARGWLHKDPYNPDLVKLLMTPLSRWETDDSGQRRMVMISRPTPEEMLDYTRRMLIASPYDADYWKAYLEAKIMAEGFKSVAALEPYQINMIAYSQHRPDLIQEYFMEKVYAFDAMAMVAEGEFGVELAKIQAATDIDRDILCPFTRALRVHESVCAGKTAVLSAEVKTPGGLRKRADAAGCCAGLHAGRCAD